MGFSKIKKITNSLIKSLAREGSMMVEQVSLIAGKIFLGPICRSLVNF